MGTGGKLCHSGLTAQNSEQQSDMNFISDNQAGAHPAVLAAIAKPHQGWLKDTARTDSPRLLNPRSAMSFKPSALCSS